MNNTLTINVGTFAQFDHPYTKVCVIASDLYSQDVLTFDDKEHLLNCYPSKEDLIVGVLKLPVFHGGAIVYEDGTYELDSIQAVVVNGFPT